MKAIHLVCRIMKSKTTLDMLFAIWCDIDSSFSVSE